MNTMSAWEASTAVRLRRGTSIPKTRTASVDIPIPGAGPLGVGHGLAMTATQQAGNRHLIRPTSSVHGAIHAPDVSGAAA